MLCPKLGSHRKRRAHVLTTWLALGAAEHERRRFVDAQGYSFMGRRARGIGMDACDGDGGPAARGHANCSTRYTSDGGANHRCHHQSGRNGPPLLCCIPRYVGIQVIVLIGAPCIAQAQLGVGCCSVFKTLSAEDAPAALRLHGALAVFFVWHLLLGASIPYILLGVFMLGALANVGLAISQSMRGADATTVSKTMVTPPITTEAAKVAIEALSDGLHFAIGITAATWSFTDISRSLQLLALAYLAQSFAWIATLDGLCLVWITVTTAAVAYRFAREPIDALVAGVDPQLARLSVEWAKQSSAVRYPCASPGEFHEPLRKLNSPCGNHVWKPAVHRTAGQLTRRHGVHHRGNWPRQCLLPPLLDVRPLPLLAPLPCQRRRRHRPSRSRHGIPGSRPCRVTEQVRVSDRNRSRDFFPFDRVTSPHAPPRYPSTAIRPIPGLRSPLAIKSLRFHHSICLNQHWAASRSPSAGPANIAGPRNPSARHLAGWPRTVFSRKRESSTSAAGPPSPAARGALCLPRSWGEPRQRICRACRSGRVQVRASMRISTGACTSADRAEIADRSANPWQALGRSSMLRCSSHPPSKCWSRTSTPASSTARTPKSGAAPEQLGLSLRRAVHALLGFPGTTPTTTTDSHQLLMITIGMA